MKPSATPDSTATLTNLLGDVEAGKGWLALC